MLEVLRMDYIVTARAKGLPERRVIWKHALRNALIAPVTMLGMQFGWMLGNTILIESIFGWGGIGYFTVTSIYNRDFPVIIGISLVMCLIFVIGNTLVDIVYTFLDPKIRY
jgi:glutathione transport system permease protein